jgi:hypothetical protein
MERVDGVNERVRMTRLTTVGGAFAARVLQARLEDEGLTVALRGCIDGPYAFTVGAMGGVEVFVAEDDLEDAKLILLVTEVDSALDRPPRSERPTAPAFERAFWVLLIVILVLAVFPIVRMATG